MRKFLKKLKGRFAYEFVILMLTLAFILIGGTIMRQMYSSKYEEKTYDEYMPKSAKDNTNAADNPQNSMQEDLKPLPDKAIVEMLFTTQAPNANWDAVHEESCEEASLIMLKHYIEKTKIGSKDDADREIMDLIDFENNNGYKVDVTVAELSQIAKSKYGLGTGRVKQNATADDIKREIASGRPVIIPAAGKLLNNPNFKGGGPNYHMLVVKGYDKDGFITNDPGTRKGEGYRYSFDTLFNAIHDWDASNILNGAKNYLVFD